MDGLAHTITHYVVTTTLGVPSGLLTRQGWKRLGSCITANHDLCLDLARTLAIFLLRVRLSLSNLVLFACGASRLSLSSLSRVLVLERESASDFFPFCLSSSYPSPMDPVFVRPTERRMSSNSSSRPRPRRLPLLMPDPPSARSSSSRFRLRASFLFITNRVKLSSSNSVIR